MPISGVSSARLRIFWQWRPQQKRKDTPEPTRRMSSHLNRNVKPSNTSDQITGLLGSQSEAAIQVAASLSDLTSPFEGDWSW